MSKHIPQVTNFTLSSMATALLVLVLLQLSQRSDALRDESAVAPRIGLIASNPRASTVLAFVTRGGGGSVGSTDRETEFKALLRKAQLDPGILEDETNTLNSLKRLMEVPGPLPDLMTVCTMAAVYQSNIFKDGMEEGKEAYQTMKINFAKEFEEALDMGGIGLSEQEQEQGAVEESKKSITIQKCIEFLGSGYLHASFFSVESFRQQVLKNPFWQGLVKVSLITHLGDDCPNFDDILQDGGLWSSTLYKCSQN